MSNSRMKQAIDETIGQEPLLQEALVEKMMEKKSPKKTRSWLQPALVLLLIFAVGAVLYFTPGDTDRSATEIVVEAKNLSAEQRMVVEDFYAAIQQKDADALSEVSEVNAELAFSDYSSFDLTKPLEVVKTIEDTHSLTLFVKLQGDYDTVFNKIQFVKESNKIEVGTQHLHYIYQGEVLFPKTITLDYRTAPFATEMINYEIEETNFAYEPMEVFDGTLYQLKMDNRTWRIFKTQAGKLLDLGSFSEVETTVVVGKENELFLIDEATSFVTMLYKNSNGEYQTVAGDLGRDIGISFYQYENYKQPLLLWGGTEPKIVTTRDGQLIVANIFEQAKFERPIEFYSAETFGPNLLVKYNEDFVQQSKYFTLTDFETYTTVDSTPEYEAKASHLKNMMLAGRHNDSSYLLFSNGTLEIVKDTRFQSLQPNVNGEQVEPRERTEITYTNIEVYAEGNQYFITGDEGFTMTLTRTGERIFIDDEGIEYTSPTSFK